MESGQPADRTRAFQGDGVMGSAVVRAPWFPERYPRLSPPGQTVPGRRTPLLDTELGRAVRCQLSRVSLLVLLHRDPSHAEGQLARTYLLHLESLITTVNLAACMFGLQTSLVLDYTIRSIAEEKGKRNPPQTCLHKMLSASTGLFAELLQSCRGGLA